MESRPDPQSRIIIRVHEVWQDEYEMVERAWFSHCGYADDYDWTYDHSIYLGGVDGSRFHIIIDMNSSKSPDRQLDTVTHQIYRFRKQQLPNSMPYVYYIVPPSEKLTPEFQEIRSSKSQGAATIVRCCAQLQRRNTLGRPKACDRQYKLSGDSTILRRDISPRSHGSTVFC